MPLTGSGLADLTFTGHVALFPPAATVLRSNASTGVAAHNPAQKLIEGLAKGLVDTVSDLKWKGAISGTAVTGGVASPALFTIPGSVSAASAFLSSSGWSGPSAALFAQSVIQNMLVNISALSVLQGDTSTTVGTGTAVFGAASNPDIYSTALSSLLTTLPVALQETGVFGQGDVPGAPINSNLAASIPHYAEAYAQGLSTLTASVAYAGGASTSAATGIVTGSVV